MRRSALRFKSIVQGKTKQGVVEFLLIGNLPNENVFHPIIQKLFRYSAEILKRPDMTIQKCGQITPFYQLPIDLPGIPQDQGEQVEFLYTAVSLLHLELSKIHLILVPWLCLKSHVGNLLPFRLDPTLADAIMDRIVHNAYRLTLKGGSQRKKQKNLTQTGH